MELNFYSKIPYSDWKIPTTGFISKFSLTIWKWGIIFKVIPYQHDFKLDFLGLCMK